MEEEVKGGAFLARVPAGLAGETDLEALAEELGVVKGEGGTAAAKAVPAVAGMVVGLDLAEVLDRVVEAVAATADYKSRRT